MKKIVIQLTELTDKQVEAMVETVRQEMQDRGLRGFEDVVYLEVQGNEYLINGQHTRNYLHSILKH